MITTQIMIHKPDRRKQNIEPHESHKKPNMVNNYK